MKNNLKSMRNKIDSIDKQISMLFQRRMQISKIIAYIKQEENIQITNKNREHEVIERVRNFVDDEIKDSIEELYNKIMFLSRRYQKKSILKKKEINNNGK